MNKQKNRELLYAQLALDYHAGPEDFCTPGIVLTEPALCPGRRAYSTELSFLELVTTGQAAVLMADPRLHPALEEWLKGVEESHWLLEFPRLLSLSRLLEPYGYELTQTHHGYLPAENLSPTFPPKGFSLCWLERGEIDRFYPNKAWPNALQERENPARPDMLALAAMDGESIAGLAGVSADGELLWQIGIDVLPEYRSRGLGTLLVRNLAAELAQRGKLPFYYSSLSNLHSQSIALGCGFRPAWVDISARKREV